MKNVIYLLLVLLVLSLEAMQQDNGNNCLLTNRSSQSVTTITEEVGVHLAAQNGDIETVKKLLDNGVSVNERNADYETPLHMASRMGDDAIVQFLLTQKRIDVNAVDALMYSTPLHVAVRYGKVGIVQLLLAKNGIDINAIDDLGYTPLHSAAIHGYDDIVQLLLAKEGINISVKANDGKTALNSASDNGFISTVKILGDFLERQLFQVLDFSENEKKRIQLSSFNASQIQLRCHIVQRMRAAQIKSGSMFIPEESATFKVALSYMSEEEEDDDDD